MYMQLHNEIKNEIYNKYPYDAMKKSRTYHVFILNSNNTKCTPIIALESSRLMRCPDDACFNIYLSDVLFIFTQ